MPTAMLPDTPPWRPMEPMRSELGQALVSTLREYSSPRLRCWLPKKGSRSSGRFRSESSLDEPIGRRRHIRLFPRKHSSRNRCLPAAQALVETMRRRRHLRLFLRKQSSRNRSLPAAQALEEVMRRRSTAEKTAAILREKSATRPVALQDGGPGLTSSSTCTAPADYVTLRNAYFRMIREHLLSLDQLTRH